MKEMTRNMKCTITSGAWSQSFTCSFSHQYTSSSLQKYLHLASEAAFEYNTSLEKAERMRPEINIHQYWVSRRDSLALGEGMLSAFTSVLGVYGDNGGTQLTYKLSMFSR